MTMIAKVGAAIQRLFGKVSEQAAEKTGVIQRKRKFTATTLLQTFVLGHLMNPDASDEELAQMAAQCGADVTPQAIEQRHSKRLVTFLKEVFQEAAKMAVASNRSLAPLLERFTSVPVMDGSTITLPDSMQDEFAGCGGSYDSGKAALKLQTVLELRSGAVTVEVEQGRSPDGATPRQHERHGKGSLTIKDLGFFNLDVFEEQEKAGEYYLSRLQFGTDVMLRKGDEEETADDGTQGQALDLLSWLAKQPGPFIDQPISLGKKKKLSSRLIAWRLPKEQADRRRRKLREETLRKRGREPSAERLAWCDWTILVTNTPVELLTPKETAILYGARWQVELLFKRWKSLNLVAVLSGSTEVRQMIRVWSRLIMSLLQHWLLIATIWGDPTKSLHKACKAIRDFAGRIAATLMNGLELARVLADLCAVFKKTCRRDKRSKAGTFELLNDIGLLEFRLT
jgi:DDE family transposase